VRERVRDVRAAIDAQPDGDDDEERRDLPIVTIFHR
jgi:hypothetical protein